MPRFQISRDYTRYERFVIDGEYFSRPCLSERDMASVKLGKPS
jgi:hypothetical protein